MRVWTILALALITVIGLSACSTSYSDSQNSDIIVPDGYYDEEPSEEKSEVDEPAEEKTEIDEPVAKAESKIDAPSDEIKSSQSTNWLDFKLTDVKTQESFKISDFKGEQILIESFAVWCPKCTSQQKNVQALHEDLGDSFKSISINTDPNEDESKVLDHIKSNGFSGTYVVAPAEFTKLLIDDFGTGIVSAPSVPMILVCEDQSTKFLDRGVKSVDKLKVALAAGCS